MNKLTNRYKVALIEANIVKVSIVFKVNQMHSNVQTRTMNISLFHSNLLVESKYFQLFLLDRAGELGVL